MSTPNYGFIETPQIVELRRRVSDLTVQRELQDVETKSLKTRLSQTCTQLAIATIQRDDLLAVCRKLASIESPPDGVAQWNRLYEATREAGKAVALRQQPAEPKQGAIIETMEELREAGGKAWDDIADPEAYLEETDGG